MGNEQTIYLPPWMPSTDEEKEHEEEYAKAICAISQVPRNFVEAHPVSQSPDFPFDWSVHQPFAEAAYREDANIYKFLPRLVPKRVSEEEFWRNYFSHVYAVKARYNSAKMAAGSQGAGADSELGDDEATRLSRAASLVSQVPYPQRFDLAIKYVDHGPSLPDDAAPGDRILMEVLRQQATIGPCNSPRPGLWDSAEVRARHEAWTKLGNMAKSEAMHLYVQALEIFRKDWILWEGLDLTASAGTPAAPSSAKGEAAATTTAAAMGAAGPRAAGKAPAEMNGGAPSSQAQATKASANAPDDANVAEKVYLLDVSPSSRAVAVVLALLPGAKRAVRIHAVKGVDDLPDSVHRGCAKLPLLVSAKGDFELWDAHAIMGFLVDKYAPSGGRGDLIFPTDSPTRAKVQQFLAYRQATLWPAVRDHVFAQLFPSSPVCPVSRGSALREYVENAERRLQMELNRLNTVFLEDGGFLVGPAPCVADVSCACAISLLDWVTSPRVDHYPHVASWFRAVSALPGYKEMAAAHKQFGTTPNSVQQGHFALALIE